MTVRRSLETLACASLLALATIAAGCGGRTYGWDREGGEPVARAPVADAAALEAEARATWPRRDEEPALRATIATLEKLLAARGGADRATLVWLARASYILGEVTATAEVKLAAYEAGMGYGDRALDAIPAFHARFAETKSVEEAVEAVPRDGIDAIYWDAVNVGKWSKAKGMTKALFLKDKVRRMIERVVALDPRWWYGAGNRYLGAYWSALPTISGRDLAKSRAHFDRSLAVEPRYLATHTLIAEYLARGANDRKLYKSELELVLATPEDALPEIAPEQRIERRKARKLLDDIDEYFDEEEPAPAPPAGGAAPPAAPATPAAPASPAGEPKEGTPTPGGGS